ncbi:MAG: proton-conducting transporter membrane subunit [Candidatus Ozemobacteraceae bacterium]
MLNVALFMVILGPIVFGLGAFVAPDRTLRSFLTAVAALVTPIGAALLVKAGNGPIAGPPIWFPTLLEWSMIAIVILIGRRLGRSSIIGLGIAQGVLALIAEFIPQAAAETAPGFVVDSLSLIMVVVISVVGSIILVYAIGYMEHHEHHGPAEQSSQGQFFFFLIAFLGFMNGLVLANDLRWLSVFWEATTLCSFVLIGHDRTDEARASAERAILINVFGGTIMMLGVVIGLAMNQGESLSSLVANHSVLPLALLTLAAFTKSAQMPFQSWLLGAMVAPTPVSALLHSSTMVKAGVYLVVRMAPGYADTRLASVVALAGAFTFAVASAIAISQSNGKKVLAYSTIGNLGLIITCAAINTPLAFAAAVMLIIFHAVSKAMLFISMGTVEQEIGSRDIEDMAGLMHKMPFTTIVMILGMVSMMVPPFGVLFGKWMAMEAGIHSPLVMLLIVAGNAFSVVFWAKWIGRITTASYHKTLQMEKLPLPMSLSMLLLAAATALNAFTSIPLYYRIIQPLALETYKLVPQSAASVKMLEMVSSFMEWPLIAMLIMVIASIILTFRSIDRSCVRLPFLCGENIIGSKLTFEFRGPMDRGVTAQVRSYYMTGIFGEEGLTAIANPISLALVLSMFGVIIV